MEPNPGKIRPLEKREEMPVRKVALVDRDWGRITNQDYENMARVQTGMRSCACAVLRLNPRREANVLHMHRVIDRYLVDRV